VQLGHLDDDVHRIVAAHGERLSQRVRRSRRACEQRSDLLDDTPLLELNRELECVLLERAEQFRGEAVGGTLRLLIDSELPGRQLPVENLLERTTACRSLPYPPTPRA
jgi:hypothetical protein